MAIYDAGPNLAADLVAQAAKFLPQLWKRGAELSEQNADFLMDFEGSGKDAPIMTETDLSKGAGQKITFRTMAGLYGDGVIGDELIDNNVEKLRVGAFDLEVDWVRHATRYTLRTKDQAALSTEITSGLPVQLGNWLGRKKCSRMFMMFRENGGDLVGSPEPVFANNKGSREALKSADTISMDTITIEGQVLKTRGANPAKVGHVGTNDIKRFCAIATSEGLTSMKQGSDYRQAVREGGLRGDANVMFQGGYVDIDGHIIKEFTPIDHDGFGAIGSALNPKAWLGTATTNVGTAEPIQGGGSATAAALTEAKYFEYFSNSPYRFGTNELIAADTSTDRYCIIYNLTGVNAGKMGFYNYTTNDGNTITMKARLHSSVTGIGNTTVGNVTYANWNGTLGIWTNVHPVGSLVIETNSYGVPIGRMLYFGARGACRGYGSYRNLRTEDDHDGGFVKDVFISSTFGQTPWKRTDNKTNNYLVVEHALEYAGIDLPVIS